MKIDSDRLRRLFSPRSIAVIGGTESERVLVQTRKLGYRGETWAVNPGREHLAGVPCLASLEQLPEVPDAVFVGIPAAAAIDAVRELDAMGVGGAVCLASGFGEVGENGRQRQRQLLDAAAGMPVLGPNCYGYINALSGAALFPDQHGLRRVESGVAIVSCSGNIGLNFTLQQRGLDVAWLVTVGNQAVIGIEEVVAAALDNENIRAIGLHIEGLNDPAYFVELAGLARERGVPMVALKTGRSSAGARITLSHTATLAGESGLYSALFERVGVGQADTVEEFLEALKLACVAGPLAHNRLASMSCSGGEASLVADLSGARDLEFPGLEPDHRQQVQATLNDYVSVDNPLDYHTFIWGDEDKMTRTFSAMLRGDFALTLLVIDYPHAADGGYESWLTATRAFMAACSATGARGAVVTCLSESFTPEIHAMLIEGGVTPLHGMAQALAAIECMYRVGRAWQHWNPPAVPASVHDETDPARVTALDELEAKALLSGHGIPVPEARRAAGVDECIQAADRIGYPVVLKALSKEIAHKSELGAVVTGIRDAAELEQHAGRLLRIAPELMVEEMVDGVAELLIGVAHDRQFGHHLILGFGGTLVELVRDRQILMLPVTREAILEALARLKAWPLLDGFRGRPRADVEAVAEAALKVAALARERAGELVELEINPLMVLPRGRGVKAVDALIRMRAPREPDANQNMPGG